MSNSDKMEITIRKEITIAINGDFAEALVAKQKYLDLGYILYEENDDFIQLDIPLNE